MKEALAGLEAAMNKKMLNVPELVRPWTFEYDQEKPMPRHLVLTGLRGCGKSTFLLHQSRTSGRRFLYLSADNPLFSQESLYRQASYIFSQGYEGLIVDEVHYAKDWSLHLKALQDDFPDRCIWASDSSALILRKGVADLSRRYVFIHMPVMSFREFLYLETGRLYPKSAPLADFQQGSSLSLPVTPDADLLARFVQYKAHGTRPFYQEGNYQERSLAVLDKTLNSDVPFFVSHVTDDNLRLMKAIVGSLAYATIPRIQVRSLCSDWGIGAEKLYQLLEVMEAVGALQIIRFENDRKARSAGAKLFFADPCLYSVLRGEEGNIREAFVSMALREAGFEVAACRDERTGDFAVSRSFGRDRFVVEVGGHKKVPKDADFVVRDNMDYPGGNAIPLWLLLMMW